MAVISTYNLQNDSFKEALGALGYVGFAYMAGVTRPDPAHLLMDALNSEHVDSRVAEGLPWLLVAFPRLDWEWLVSNAKAKTRQNRLAFLTSVAAEVARKKQNFDLAAELSARVSALEPFRLQWEDTLCQEYMYDVERQWLRTHRSPAAAHWNLLTDLNADHLEHALL